MQMITRPSYFLQVSGMANFVFLTLHLIKPDSMQHSCKITLLVVICFDVWYIVVGLFIFVYYNFIVLSRKKSMMK